MAFRALVDPAETVWRVWATLPVAGRTLLKGFEHGWLTFESGSERRHLAPIPDRWEEASDTELRTFLGASAR
jgi:hypothetical protein